MHARLPFPARALLSLVAAAGLAGTLIVADADAETIRLPGSTGIPGITLRSQSATGVELHFEIGELGMDPLEVAGESYIKLSVPGVFLPNDAGAPDLPGLSRMIAVPRGATVRLEIRSARMERRGGVRVSPAPVIPSENHDGPLAIAEDPAIYGRNAEYPVSPVAVSEPGQMRGVDVVTIGITPFAYNPVTRELEIYTEFDLRLLFEGGDGTFGEDRLRSRFWEPILAQHLLNYESLPRIDFNSRHLERDGRDGSEFIILAPDDALFLAWADSIRTWRQLQGISTAIYTTTEIGGNTTAAIESFLNNAYHTWNPAPDAFLLLGDYPATGVDGITSPTFSATTYPCKSDNIYADVNGDNLPDLAHARITARNPTDLASMIGKLLAYERAPYVDPAFYAHPLIAGGWQTERWFILCTEVCFGHQVNSLGKSPVREYAIYDGTPSTLWSTATNTSAVVNYFGPNGLGYLPATPQHLTDWGGNATRINNDINAGAYLVLHRDHGFEGGWGEPAYSTSNLSGLTNDQLPFVFSMNCLTGKYDYSGEVFAERFHRMAHGAVGLIAASEISYSFVNDTFLWGIWDTMWPQFMPNYGPYPPPTSFATEMRPCFGMVSGKYFLASSSWPYNSGDKVVTYHLFHHHGDPFQFLYSEVPQPISVTHDDACLIGTSTFQIQAEAGALIGLTIDGQIVGVADATGLPQEVTITPPTVPGSLRVTVTKANRFRYDELVPVLPPSGPYLIYHACEVLDASGDNDGALDFGESDGLRVTLRNVGIDSTSAAVVTLTSIDPYVAILDAEGEAPGIPSGATGTVIEPFPVEVSGLVPDQRPIVFALQAVSAEGTWGGQFSLVSQAPVLHAGEAVTDDSPPYGNEDGLLDPGERFLLRVWISNTGHADATQLVGSLTSAGPHLSVMQATGTADRIPMGGEGLLGAFEVEISPGCPSPSMQTLELSVSGAGGFVAQLSYPISIGPWMDTAEEDLGWTLGAPGDNATSGQWIRDDPIGTTYNGSQAQPEDDHTAAGVKCFVTGNGTPGGAAGEADVDGGKTTLLSPVFNVEGATSVTLRYFRWYTNNLGNSPGIDYWTVEANDGGPSWLQLERTTASANSWTERSFNLHELLNLTNTLQLRFIAEDLSPGSLVEAAVDDVTVTILRMPSADAPQAAADGPAGIVSCTPNPAGSRARLAFRLTRRETVHLDLFDVSGRRVRTLLQGPVEPGLHALGFQPVDRRGHPLAAGIYFLRLETPTLTQVRQVAFLR